MRTSERPELLQLTPAGRGAAHAAKRRAQQLIAASYTRLVAYIGIEAVRDQAGGNIHRSAP